MKTTDDLECSPIKGKYDSMTVSSFAGYMGEISILTFTLEEAENLSKEIIKIFGRSQQDIWWKSNPRITCVENGITDEERIRNTNNS